MLIMTFATKSFSSVSDVVTRVAARGFITVANVIKAIIHRRDVLRLTELDERGLKDLGLVRSDVEGALATSWLSDPSAILAARSSARSGVASARREEGLRQAQVKSTAAPRAAIVALPARARRKPAATEAKIACNA
ncbi:hypothetical protein AXW83_00310 [Bosea sp. PAMC 26642]|nr:hypothetical protein AXW83_00310 [Bosea sp. PAMC 26642]